MSSRLESCFAAPTIRPSGALAMSTLFAFLHHVCAFTLVSAVAIEFALIRGALTLLSARRLQVTDFVLGIAAGGRAVARVVLRFFFLKEAGYFLPPPSPLLGSF